MTAARFLPTFFVVGAARCGTTSLHYYLAQHPQVAMSATKEPNFFLFRPAAGGPQPLFGDDRRLLAKSIADPRRYAGLFTPGACATGEVSPLYLYTRETPALIAASVPDARIIAVLREPADRAWSHFAYVSGDLTARAAAAFADAVRQEAPLGYTPYRAGTHYLRLGRYGEQVARYLDHFPAEHVLLLRHADLACDAGAVLATICRFLGVDDEFRFDTTVHYNPAERPAGGLGLLDRLLQPAAPYLKRVAPAGLVAPLARRRHERRANTAATPLRGSPESAAGDAPVHTSGPSADHASGPDSDTFATLRSYYRDDLARLHRLTGVELAACAADAR